MAAQSTEHVHPEHALTSRVVITREAAAVLDGVIEKHGSVILHQSGGCCDGSGPSCFRASAYIVSPQDRLLGFVGTDAGNETPLWISSTQFDAWKHTQVIVDVVPGVDLGSFSLEGADGFVFISRGRVFHPEELAALPAAPTRTEVDAKAPLPPIAEPVDLQGTFGDACGVMLGG